MGSTAANSSSNRFTKASSFARAPNDIEGGAKHDESAEGDAEILHGSPAPPSESTPNSRDRQDLGELPFNILHM